MTEKRLSVSIRMPEKLLERLRYIAITRSHSMNAEIVQRLEESLVESEMPKNHVLTPRELRQQDARYDLEDAKEELEHAKKELNKLLDTPGISEFELAVARQAIRNLEGRVFACRRALCRY